MKTNFEEFMLQSNIIGYEFYFICFTDTNMSSDDSRFYTISNNYHCKIVSKKIDKQREQVSLFITKIFCNFLSSIHYAVKILILKCWVVKTDIGYIYIIVVYRLHRSNADDFREEIAMVFN